MGVACICKHAYAYCIAHFITFQSHIYIYIYIYIYICSSLHTWDRMHNYCLALRCLAIIKDAPIISIIVTNLHIVDNEFLFVFTNFHTVGIEHIHLCLVLSLNLIHIHTLAKGVCVFVMVRGEDFVRVDRFLTSNWKGWHPCVCYTIIIWRLLFLVAYSGVNSALM